MAVCECATCTSANQPESPSLSHSLSQSFSLSLTLSFSLSLDRAQVAALERRVSELETTQQESEHRLSQLANQNAALASEKLNLQHEVHNMHERNNKLDAFKRSIMQSVKEDDLPPIRASAAEYNGGGGSGGYRNAALLAEASATVAAARPSLGGSYHAGGASAFDVPPLAPYSATPAADRPRTAAPRPSYGGAPHAESPLARGRESSGSPGVDGKDFFRSARLRLSYEQFNRFLANIKRLNDHAQSREETLQRAQDIFGPENGDLYTSFKSLLSKHGLD